MKDNLFTTRTVFYRTLPPSQEEVDMIAEQAALNALDELTDEQKERLEELNASNVTVDEYRFTVGSISVLQDAQVKAKQRLARAWILERFGVSAYEYSNLPVEERQEDWLDNLRLMNNAWAWATVTVAIRKIEHRLADMLSDKTLPWETESMPEEWATIEGFLDSLQFDLLDALKDKISQLNPTAINGGDSEEAKKFGVISVN